MTTLRSLNRKLIWFTPILLVLIFGMFVLLSGARAGSEEILKVGMVTGSPILMDGGFNEMAYTGLMQAVTTYGIEETVYLSTDSEEISQNLSKCVVDGNNLCIMVGWLGMDQTHAAAQAHPGTYFAILDMPSEEDLPNLQGAVFATGEAAYLAGTLASYMTESKILGLIGGMDIWPVNEFLCGFRQGALDADPESSMILTYADTFIDPVVGASIAQDMLDQGADVIFPAAGSTGNGALLTAADAGAWAVGVDSDQYLTVFGNGAVDNAEYLLTSVMKRVDHAVFQIISETLTDSFVSGTVVYDLAVEGVGLAPYHEADPYIPAEAKTAVEAARIDLLSGAIDPLRACPPFHIYLPGIAR